MIKFKIFFSTLVAFLMFSGAAFAFTFEPVNSFIEWVELEHLGQFQHSGNTTTVTLKGNSEYRHNANLYSDVTGHVGILATINVATFEGDSSVGIGMYPGRWGDNRIFAEMYLLKTGSQYSISYLIRLRDSQDNFVGDLAQGRFGGKDIQIIGNNITIGFARNGNEIIFYAGGYSYITWKPLFTMGNGTDVAKESGDIIVMVGGTAISNVKLAVAMVVFGVVV